MTARSRGVDSVKVVTLIETTTLIGSGLKEDPHRDLVQYWNMDGELVAEKDSFLEKEQFQPLLNYEPCKNRENEREKMDKKIVWLNSIGAIESDHKEFHWYVPEADMYYSEEYIKNTSLEEIQAKYKRHSKFKRD